MLAWRMNRSFVKRGTHVVLAQAPSALQTLRDTLAPRGTEAVIYQGEALSREI